MEQMTNADGPEFTEPLHVGRPNLGDRDRFRQRIEGALDRQWLTDGPLVAEFEAALAEVTGTGYCVAMCNATAGIQVAARASGLVAGDEVLVPGFTWVATAHALDWIGIVPVFCDVDEVSGTIDPDHAERLIGPRTRGILGVHVFGHPCEIDRLAELAWRHDLVVLYDAAHGIGCTYRGSPIGGFGTAEVFSFHANKYVNSFEGGAIVTNDAVVAGRARAMRNFGITPDRKVAFAGTNAKLTEGAAAMGLTSLESMPDFAAANRANHRRYRAGLAGVPGISVREQADGEVANHQYLVIEVDAALAGIHRDRLHELLTRNNVLSRPYFHPACHQLLPYADRPDRHAPLPLPRAEALADRVLALPTGTAVTATDIDRISDLIRRLVPNGC